MIGAKGPNSSGVFGTMFSVSSPSLSLVFLGFFVFATFSPSASTISRSFVWPASVLHVTLGRSPVGRMLPSMVSASCIALSHLVCATNVADSPVFWSDRTFLP